MTHPFHAASPKSQLTTLQPSNPQPHFLKKHPPTFLLSNLPAPSPLPFPPFRPIRPFNHASRIPMLSRTTFGASSGFSRASTFTPTGPRRTSLTRGSPRSRNRMCWLRFSRCFSQAGRARGAGGGVAGRWAGAAARRAAGRRAGRLARSRSSAAGSLSAAGVCWPGFRSLRRAAACEARRRARSRRLSLAAASRLVGGLVRDAYGERRGGREACLFAALVASVWAALVDLRAEARVTVSGASSSSELVSTMCLG